MDEPFSGHATVMVPLLRRCLKSKIRNSSELEGCSAQRTQLTNLITRVVQFGESDSALICGPPGSGKTKLVSTVLKELQGNHDFFLVKLNGLIHTDDNLALKEIVQTLNADESIVEEASGSFAGNLTAILETLINDSSTVDRPIVFILEEFQLFCSHRKQTLLYTLMDASQSTKVPVCVIGVTSCFEVTQLLEKRVKSRFSHNQIFLYPPNDFNSRLELFKHFVTFKDEDVDVDVDDLSISPGVYSFLWQQEVQKVIDNPKVIEVLKRQFGVDKNEQTFRNTMLMVISEIDLERNQFLSADLIIRIFNDTFRDFTVFALRGLSVLELCLVIAMNHQTNQYDDEPFNFGMVYRRYQKFTNECSVLVQSSRAVLLKAFQKLINLELISPVNIHSKEVLKDFNLYRFNVTNEQVQEAVKNFPDLMPAIREWATSVC